MPLGPGVHYRYKPGTKVRLAFDRSGDVVEIKNMKTGATHTPAEFEAERSKARRAAARDRAKGGRG